MNRINIILRLYEIYENTRQEWMGRGSVIFFLLPFHGLWEALPFIEKLLFFYVLITLDLHSSYLIILFRINHSRYDPS